MSAIDDKYIDLLKTCPWIGAPAGPEMACTDGVGFYREYLGGASIYYTPATGAHLLHGLIRSKWIALGREKGPNGYPISDEAEAGSNLGRYNNFQNGTIIWKRGTSEAFAVYGEIYGKWGTLHYDRGPLGFPLNDEAAAGTTGRFNDFEHGAIYWNGTTGTHVVRSPVLEAWTLANRDKGLLRFPTADTPATKDAQGAFVQSFQGGRISCTEGASRSIVTSEMLSPRIEPRTRALIIDEGPTYAEAWKAPGINDRRRCPVTRLNRHLKLSTALVIFRGSYTRTLTDAEIQSVRSSYETARAKFRDFNFGIASVKTKVIVVESTLHKSPDFNNYQTTPPSTDFHAEFAAYAKVRDALHDHGFGVDDFDVINICIPWADTAGNKASGFAWANPVAQFEDDKTWSTVHYLFPPGATPYWWAFFVHEITHCVEWMLEKHGYLDMRNNDDPWWGAAYPTLASSTVVPSPENVPVPNDPTDARLYAMHQRIKGSWFGLSPTWGQVIKDTTTLEDYGQIITYSCPQTGAIIETAWSIKFLGLQLTTAEFQAVSAQIQALNAQKASLQAELQKAAPGQQASLVAQIKKINGELSTLATKSMICNAMANLLNT